VTQPPEPYHVYDNILLKLLAIVERDLKHIVRCFHIIAVDVKNRRLNHLCDIGAVGG